MIILDQSFFLSVGEDLGNERSPHFTVLVPVVIVLARNPLAGAETIYPPFKDLSLKHKQFYTPVGNYQFSNFNMMWYHES